MKREDRQIKQFPVSSFQLRINLKPDDYLTSYCMHNVFNFHIKNNPNILQNRGYSFVKHVISMFNFKLQVDPNYSVN